MKKTKPKALIIEIRSRRALFTEMRDLFTRLDKHMPIDKPIHRLYFEDMATLWKTLTPKRTELMQRLRKHGPLSIRKLSFELQRDYKNVHTDIKELVAVGLVKSTKNDRYEVPWDIIDLAIPLAA